MDTPKSALSTSLLVMVVSTCMLIFLGCNEEDSQFGSHDERLHPFRDLIPTYDVETIPVTNDEASDRSNTSIRLRSVSESLDDLQSTGIFVRSPSSVHADQLGEDRLVVLDAQHDLLMVHHTESGSTDTVAVNDGAPNNVAHATGMDVYRDTVYVSTMDRRLQTFDCSVECSYAGTTTLDFSATGVAAREGRVSLIGFTYDANEENHGMLSELVHRMAGEEVEYRFMAAYSSGNPLVDSELNEGFVAHAGGYDVFAFHHMPYLYVFDEGEAVAIFEIDEFHPMDREEGVDPYSISVPTAARYSSISRVQNHSDDELIVVVRTRDRGRRVESLQEAQQVDPDDVSITVDYYLVDMSSMAPTHLGSLTFDVEGGPYFILTADYEMVIDSGEVKYAPK